MKVFQVEFFFEVYRTDLMTVSIAFKFEVIHDQMIKDWVKLFHCVKFSIWIRCPCMICHLNGKLDNIHFDQSFHYNVIVFHGRCFCFNLLFVIVMASYTLAWHWNVSMIPYIYHSGRHLYYMNWTRKLDVFIFHFFPIIFMKILNLKQHLNNQYSSKNGY